MRLNKWTAREVQTIRQELSALATKPLCQLLFYTYAPTQKYVPATVDRFFNHAQNVWSCLIICYTTYSQVSAFLTKCVKQ